jgi:hypothetical protein
MGIGDTYESQPGLRLAPWLALGVETRFARCHHKSSCASTTPRTVFKPQSERKTPWRARCFSGMRWSGCGTALQRPNNRNCVRFADARQHRGRAWYIEAVYEWQSSCGAPICPALLAGRLRAAKIKTVLRVLTRIEPCLPASIGTQFPVMSARGSCYGVRSARGPNCSAIISGVLKGFLQLLNP